MKLSIAFLAAVLSTAALAQQQESQNPPATPNAGHSPSTATAPHTTSSVDVAGIFDKLNTSHDGKLTRDQAQAHPTVAANFDSVDANHDGVITKAEFLAAFSPPQ